MPNILKEQSRLEIFYTIGFILILFLPVLEFPPYFSPPDFGKIVVLKFIISILAIFFLWEILSKRGLELTKNKIFWLVIGFWIVMGAATILSQDRTFSFFGDPDRSDGFLNFSLYVIFFGLLYFKIRDFRRWEKLINFAMLASVFVGMAALLQWFLPPGPAQEILGLKILPSDRPSGTIGSPTFLAAYMLIFSFAAFTLGIKADSFKKRLFYFGVWIFQIFIIWLAQSRGAMMGLGIGVLSFVFLLPKSVIPRFPVDIKYLKIAFAVIILAAIPLFLTLRAGDNIFSAPDKMVSKIADTLSVEQEGRLLIWQNSLEAMKDKPVFGYGPGNFYIAFNRFYDPLLENNPGGPEKLWWDKAHNFIFDTGVTAGLAGLVFYLGIWISVFWLLLKKNRIIGADDAQVAVLKIGLAAAFAAYLVQNLFSFDSVSIYIALFFLLAFAAFLAEKDGAKSIRVKIPIPVSIILFAAAPIIIFFLNVQNIGAFLINKEINEALILGRPEVKRFSEGVKKIENVISRRNKITDHYLRNKLVQILNNWSAEGVDDLFNPNYSFSLESAIIQKKIATLIDGLKIRPKSVRNWMFLGHFYRTAIERGAGGSELDREVDFAFSEAAKLSPRRSIIYSEWGQAKLYLAKWQESQEKFQKAIETNPQVASYYWYLALAQLGGGNKPGFEQNRDTAQGMGYPVGNEESTMEMIQVFGQKKDWKPMVDLYLRLFEMGYGGNPQLRASLASVYQQLGEFDLARKEALRVLELRPEAREDVERFLQMLPQ